MFSPGLLEDGFTPAGGSWTTFGGPRRQIQIGPGAALAGIRHDGSNEVVKSLAFFCNVVRHENRHVQQVFDNNTVPFYSGVTGALREAPCAGWSFGTSPGTTANCGGTIVTPWNHFTDQNHDGIFNFGDSNLDPNGDDLAETLEPSVSDLASCSASGNPTQCQAQMAETCTADSVKASDWSDHGLQHFFQP